MGSISKQQIWVRKPEGAYICMGNNDSAIGKNAELRRWGQKGGESNA